jgi:hypothetical protein
VKLPLSPLLQPHCCCCCQQQHQQHHLLCWLLLLLLGMSACWHAHAGLLTPLAAQQQQPLPYVLLMPLYMPHICWVMPAAAAAAEEYVTVH